MADLPPQYSPQQVEERRYAWWDSQGFFQADVEPTRTPYTIVIPPPNVTGILHMGHALNNTIQDILIRWKRMQGANALWVPGTDHAGIATQNVVEKALAKEGKRRQDVGREAFVKRVWEWKEQYGNTILYQLRRLGSSCDWRRTRFTMDEGLSEAVLEAFVRLYDKGLIYRGNYIINWCPRCQTALADEEAPRQETQGKLYHIRYPVMPVEPVKPVGDKQQPANRPTGQPAQQFIEVATTRPETMLGDTAVAVHPKDKRYKSLIGKHAVLPLVNRRLPIIADEAVEKEFGTGAVKVTPAHDPVDFQLGKKHRLEFVNVMTNDAKMTNVPAAYEGLDRFDCRSKLIVDLEQAGVLGAIDEHVHNVGHCYRCHTVVEPRLSPQWFVKMKPLAEPAIRAVKNGTIKFVPTRWTKVYLNWMENIQDWCVSRQIWWGHRLPVYYCQKCTSRQQPECGMRNVECGMKSKTEATPNSELRTPNSPGVIVSKTRPAKCPTCGSADLTQDEDVLDTWFSSWLWPFSTLGWPAKTKELGYFYPTDTLVTAQEIIFFWVARMIMAGYFCMKQPPFTTVYIHGTVRDLTGKKMSKSLGNIIDPLEIIRQYGTDALRYTLVTATAIGQDIFLSEERFAAGRNFANKLWNAIRFVLSQEPGKFGMRNSECGMGRILHSTFHIPHSQLTVPDRWILSRLQRTIVRVTGSLEQLLFNDAATALYDFLWHDFCDWYLEISKIKDQTVNRQVLVHVLETGLRLLHPIMPFVTEELWQHLRNGEWGMGNGELDKGRSSIPHSELRIPNSIMVAQWPKADSKLLDAKAESHMEQLKDVVGAIRNTRAELNVPLDRRPPVRLAASQPAVRSFFEAHRPLLQSLASAGEVSVEATRRRLKDAACLPRRGAGMAAVVVDGIEVLIPLTGLIDAGKERARLQGRVEELTKQLAGVEARLKDAQFRSKAPKEVVEQTKERRAQLQDTLKKFSEHLAVLQSM